MYYKIMAILYRVSEVWGVQGQVVALALEPTTFKIQHTDSLHLW